MAGKKKGNHNIGGDKKTRDKLRRDNPRKNKKGGRTSINRWSNSL